MKPENTTQGEGISRCRTIVTYHPPRDNLSHCRERTRMKEGDLHTAPSSLAQLIKDRQGNAKVRKSKRLSFKNQRTHSEQLQPMEPKKHSSRVELTLLALSSLRLEA